MIKLFYQNKFTTFKTKLKMVNHIKRLGFIEVDKYLKDFYLPKMKIIYMGINPYDEDVNSKLTPIFATSQKQLAKITIMYIQDI